MRSPVGIVLRGGLVCLLALLVGQAACEGQREELEPHEPLAADAPIGKTGQQGLLPGRWRKARPSVEPLSAEDRKRIEELEAIGYAQGMIPAGEESGVVRHVRDEVYPGLNLHNSGRRPEAVLMDMDGRVLHSWHREFDSVWPSHPRAKGKPDTKFWRKVHLFPNGDLLAIHEGLGILKLDKDSNLLWARPYGAHHDLQVMPNGDIYLLTRMARIVPGVNAGRPVLEDFVSVLDEAGNPKTRISLLEIFRKSSQRPSWLEASREFWRKEKSRRLAGGRGDLFHTNSLEILDGRIADRVPAFAAGNALISLAHLDMIAVVDLESREVLWTLRETLALQHDPGITPDGNLLLFNNHRQPGRRSSAMLFDPLTGELLWEFDGSEDDPLYSRTCGTAAQLPNGNVLITETDNGRALEVTREKRVVWEFLSPYRVGEDEQLVASLFELKRLPPDFPTEWARSPTPVPERPPADRAEPRP